MTIQDGFEVRDIITEVGAEEQEALWDIIRKHGIDQKIPPLKMAVMLKMLFEMLLKDAGVLSLEMTNLPTAPKEELN